MIRRTSVFLILTLTWVSAVGQIDYNKQFFSAKQLFREGKYNLAMEGFKPLIPYDQNNQFSTYASFYYALSAYRQGFLAVSKDMLNQIKAQHPTWDKMDEVNYWLATIHFGNKEYFQGMKVAEAIQDKKMHKDVEVLKEKSLSGITDVQILKRLIAEYPKEELIARLLAKQLALDLTNPATFTTLDSLIEKYHFKRTDYIPEAPKTIFKDQYTVSVVMPFMVSTLDPSPIRKKNQIVLDFFEGMKLAADTLNKQGIKISLRAYDSERNVEKIKSLLQTEELRSSDLVVGPFFQEENKPIQDFSLSSKINVFNPLQSNSDIIGINPYAFLYQPSVETLGRKSGEFMADYAKRKNCMIFYGASRRDSVLVANFTQVAVAKGLKIVSTNRVTRESVGQIMATLATATEFDEFKFPSQFTLKKDSLGSIFVASDDPLIYTKVLGAVEVRKDTITVLGSEAWLDQSAVDLQKYQSLPVVLAAPNFAMTSNVYYQAFVKKFVKTHGRVPSTYSRIGYEFMLFAGQQLKKNGVYFQDGMSKQPFIPGSLTQGYSFVEVRDNQFVPFVRFKKGKPSVVSKPVY